MCELDVDHDVFRKFCRVALWYTVYLIPACVSSLTCIRLQRFLSTLLERQKVERQWMGYFKN